jgi:two-component system, NtrC family, response regulator HydG
MSATILIIDDEESLRYTFKGFLVDEGYKVLTAASFDEALACLDEAAIDLVFADIILGNRYGIDVLREIRERRLTCPVVMITGYPNIDSAAEAVRLGAFDYLAKPVRQDDLLHITRQALHQKALTDENQRYRNHLEAILRSVRDGIITVDENMRLTGFNEAARQMHGLADLGPEAIGRDFRGLAHGGNDRWRSLLLETITNRQPGELFRQEYQLAEGPSRVLSLYATPLLQAQDRFAGAVLVIRDETRLANLEQILQERQQFCRLIGRSRKMQNLYGLLENLANVQTTVLITGETGTGKELVAEAIHHQGAESSRPLVKVNCVALSENLLESELFGHIKGAFTGAIRDKIGRFQKADGGTIFLDEIGDISPAVQLRLLRVLQEKEFERVGDSTPIKVNVQVVTATNQNLREKIRLGQFREDLYFRLHVLEVHIPPLRERREDIPLLTEHFISKFNKNFNKRIEGVSDKVRNLFLAYAWPGNVRELEHTLEHAFILCQQSIITIDHLPAVIRDFEEKEPAACRGDGDEAADIKQALARCGGNKAGAARLLGISRQTIYRKIKELGIFDN